MVSTDGSALGREGRLLLATAGGESLDQAIRTLAQGPLEWEVFLALVQQERAEAIVQARLARLAIAVPEPVLGQLRAAAIRSDLRMTMLSQRLDQTVAGLAAAGVPVLLLKGAALGRTLYGSLPRRPMLDLDLLVPPERREAARDVALALDWQPGEMERKVAFYEGHYHLPPLHDALGRNFNLEIHTGLFPAGHPFAWPVEELWQQSRELAGSPARVPAREDLLLHVALHFMWSHLAHFGPWRSFRDVRVIAEDSRLDWDRFTARARAARGATAAFWTLHLARLFAGAAVPAEVERALAPRLPAGARAMLARHLANQWFPTGAQCPSARLERWLWLAAVQPERSGHGAARPWDRESVFRRSGALLRPESAGHKLLRHLGRPGRYLRYLHHIALGAGR